MNRPQLEQLIRDSLTQSPETHGHMLAARIRELEARAVVVPEPTSDEWRAIAENARSADMVDFLTGAAAYGLWLRGKIPNSIPSGRVLGEGMAQISERELACMRAELEYRRAESDEAPDSVLDPLWDAFDALRANQGGAAT